MGTPEAAVTDIALSACGTLALVTGIWLIVTGVAEVITAIGIRKGAKAVDKARAKAAAQAVDVRFVQVDATRLSTSGIGDGFDLIVDSGCLHGVRMTEDTASGSELHCYPLGDKPQFVWDN